MSTAILWFRSDLRLHDHPALHSATREYDHLAPVFVVDPKLVDGRYRSPRRVRFMFDCLQELHGDLRERGCGLLVYRGTPEHQIPRIAAKLEADAVLWTSDVSPYARRRDRSVTEALTEKGIQARPHGGNYARDISKITNGSDEPYRVFTPFSKAWASSRHRDVVPMPRSFPPHPPGIRATDPGSLKELAGDAAGLRAGQPIAQPGEAAARRAAKKWLDGGMSDYGSTHNALDVDGTSQISPYLRWGCLSPLELEHRAREIGGTGATEWVRQLCWREFYAMVLYRWPRNLDEEFQPSYRGMEWEDDEDRLDAWREGQTGYPIVDAGMRQLAQTGWMHNRARLVVGSFLTKDLQLDWRHGERWFADQLLDGEPAQNNGNWQWIASVGTDPAPVARRLFNPTLQAEKFDPDGDYIRRWVPELDGVPNEHIAEPWEMSGSEQRESGCRIGKDYPAPIVDHKTERKRALERYGSARGSSN